MIILVTLACILGESVPRDGRLVDLMVTLWIRKEATTM